MNVEKEQLVEAIGVDPHELQLMVLDIGLHPVPLVVIVVDPPLALVNLVELIDILIDCRVV